MFLLTQKLFATAAQVRFLTEALNSKKLFHSSLSSKCPCLDLKARFYVFLMHDLEKYRNIGESSINSLVTDSMFRALEWWSIYF